MRLTDYLLQAKNDPPRIGTARASRRDHSPAFASEGQFLLNPFAFQKQTDAARSEERLGKAKQPLERRTGARGHNVNRMRRHCLDAARAKHHGGLGNACRFAQEGAFSRIGFDQLDPGHAENCQDEPRQAGATAEIDHAARSVGNEFPKLRRIEDVPPPQFGDRGAPNLVDARRPPGQQLSLGFEPCQCFT